MRTNPATGHNLLLEYGVSLSCCIRMVMVLAFVVVLAFVILNEVRRSGGVESVCCSVVGHQVFSMEKLPPNYL